MVETSVALRLIQGRPWHHEFEIVPGVRTLIDYDLLPAIPAGANRDDPGAWTIF